MSAQLDAIEEGLQRFFGTVETYAQPLVSAVAVVLIVGIGFIGFDAYKGKQEDKAANALYSVEADYLKTKDAFEKGKFKDPTASAADKAADAKEAKTATGDLTKDYGNIIPGLESVAKEYPKTSAGAQASLDLADIYTDYAQWDKAIAAAIVPTENLGADQLLYAIGQLSLGNAYAGKGDCQSAVGAYSKVFTLSKNFLKPDAYLKAGVCYDKLGQNDKASEMYKKASEDAQSGTAQTARGLLRALEMKKSS